MRIVSLLKVVIVLAFIFCSETISAKDEHEIKVESTSVGIVNIRKGPGTEYAVIGQLNPGEWMWVYNEPNLEKEWVKASKMGVTGYVNTKFLRIVEESHVFESYKGLDFLPVPSFAPRLKQWAWNLIVIFGVLLILYWILFAIIGKSSSSFVWALSMACTSCIIWYVYSLGNDAFWFTDPDVSGGWLWTIGYGALFLILCFGYLYSCGYLIGDSCDELDEFQDWVWCLTGFCVYLILNAVSRLWIDWIIWFGYVALSVGILVQAFKILTSVGFWASVLFLFTCIGVYIILEPFLYILAIAAVVGLVAIAFLKGSTNGGSSSCGSDQVQFEIETEHGKSVIVTCSKYAPQSGYGDDGYRYEELPNGRWRRV